jgi:hypothetical protein
MTRYVFEFPFQKQILGIQPLHLYQRLYCTVAKKKTEPTMIDNLEVVNYHSYVRMYV